MVPVFVVILAALIHPVIHYADYYFNRQNRDPIVRLIRRLHDTQNN